MDEFSRIMMQQGVKPLHQSTASPARKPSPTSVDARSDPDSHVPAEQPATPGLPVWLAGPSALDMLKNALDMLKAEQAAGHPASIVLMRQDGETYRCPTGVSLGELLGRCDAGRVRLAIINGHEWTAVLHPQMGFATIEQDPDQKRPPE